MSDELDALLGLGPGAGGPVPRYPAPGGGPSGVDDGDGERGTELLWIHPAAVRPNHRQPREYFDEDELGALAASIEEVGILQPLLVRRIDENQYELIAGERRWRAAQRAGVEEIPVLVRRTDDQGSLEEAVVENLHRQDLTGVEEAAAYRQLMDDFGLTQEAVAQRVGKSRSAVANTLRLLLLAPEVQRLIATRQLSSGHARALLGLSERSAQAELAARIVADELSVRQTEEIVRRGRVDGGGGPATLGSGAGTVGEAGLREIEHVLSERLSTRVRASLAKGRGRLVIEFADLDDLDRIYRELS